MVIQLKALTSGYAVPRRDFSATVHSVFHEAANLQAVKSNRLLTLVSLECADLPQGMRVATPVGFSFDSHLQPGDKFTCRGGILADEQQRIEIDLASARRWKCNLPNMAADGATEQVVSAWRTVWQVLNQRQRQANADIQAVTLYQMGEHQGDGLSRKFFKSIRELLEAVRNLDPLLEPSLTGLIGLGAGLTPSGDDFLVGFLAGLHCQAGDRSERLKYLAELGKLVIRLSGRTDDISRTYLYHAAHRQVSSRLVDLVTAIAECADTEKLLKAADDSLQEGHTSGMDTVTGLLVGLSTWGNGSFPA